MPEGMARAVASRIGEALKPSVLPAQAALMDDAPRER
jgi:hypothetical protein